MGAVVNNGKKRLGRGPLSGPLIYADWDDFAEGKSSQSALSE